MHLTPHRQTWEHPIFVCRGEAFGRQTLGLRKSLFTECFALTKIFLCFWQIRDALDVNLVGKTVKRVFLHKTLVSFPHLETLARIKR
jgi:hypothetical protein